jgi:hypothetical protein
MIRGGRLFAALAGACVIPATAWGQASFGPIQPFAGAPTPVYVAGPYAAPTVLAPIGAPAYGAPAIMAPSVVAPPVVSPGIIGSAAPQVQVPAATLPPTLSVAPGFAAPMQTTVASPSCGCGSSQYYRPGLGTPVTSYSPHTSPGVGIPGANPYGQVMTHGAGQAAPGYGL